MREVRLQQKELREKGGGSHQGRDPGKGPVVTFALPREARGSVLFLCPANMVTSRPHWPEMEGTSPSRGSHLASLLLPPLPSFPHGWLPAAPMNAPPHFSLLPPPPWLWLGFHVHVSWIWTSLSFIWSSGAWRSPHVHPVLVEMCPPKTGVEALNSNTSECDLFGSRVFADVMLGWGHTRSRWANLQDDLCLYKKRHRAAGHEGRRLCGGGGETEGLQAKGNVRLPATIGREKRGRVAHSFRGSLALLDCELPASGTGGWSVSVVLSHPICGTLL